MISSGSPIFSERFTGITGVPKEALLGKTRQETGIPNVDEDAWQDHLSALAAHEPFKNFIHPRTKQDGTNGVAFDQRQTGL